MSAYSVYSFLLLLFGLLLSVLVNGGGVSIGDVLILAGFAVLIFALEAFAKQVKTSVADIRRDLEKLYDPASAVE